MRRFAGTVLPALAAGLLLAGCGSTTGAGAGAPATSASPSASARSAALRMSCGTGRATVAVGRSVVLTGCPAGVTAKATSTVLTKTAAGTFEARRAGTADIVLTAGPSCSAGTLCPQYLRFVGAISVTVTAA